MHHGGRLTDVAPPFAEVEVHPAQSQNEYDPYPGSDGITEVETPQHAAAIAYAADAVRDQARNLGRECLVTTNSGLYYRPVTETERRQCQTAPYLVPDVLVALGMTLDEATSYRIWERGKPPDLVMEMASPGTVDRDSGFKQAEYAAIGVPEYWQYDPFGEFLRPRLQGWHLQGGVYVPIAGGAYRADLAGQLWPSRALGTSWGLLDSGKLRLLDSVSDTWHWPPREGRDREAALRQEAEAQTRRDRDEIERLKALLHQADLSP